MHETRQCTNINLDEFYKEQDIEACVVKINLSSLTICILSIYRSPTGNFLHFLCTLESIHNFLHNKRIEIIICDDFNISYLNDNDKKSKLYNLFLSYNLYSAVNFPSRIHNNFITAIDNIFIGKVKYDNYSIHLITMTKL